MAADRPIRAADADRDKVVGILREETAEGRLTLDEFNERMESAYTASTWGDLRALTSDLPVHVTFDGDGQQRAQPSAPSRNPYEYSPPERSRGRHHDRFPRALLLIPLIIVALAAGSRVGPAVIPFLIIMGVCFAFGGGGSCSRRRRNEYHRRIHH